MPETGLPSTRKSWQTAIVASRAKGNEEGVNVSASKIDEWQFLNLHVLWKVSKDPARFVKNLFEGDGLREFGISHNEIETAMGELDGLSAWTAYIKHLRDLRGVKNLEPLGVFALADKHQEEVEGMRHQVEVEELQHQDDGGAGERSHSYNTRSSQAAAAPLQSEGAASHHSSPSSFEAYSPFDPRGDLSLSQLYPRAQDEQVVNTALIDLLEAVILYLPYAAHWTLHRAAFLINDWEARIDGYLRSSTTNEIKVIVEVKASVREVGTETSHVRMQEGAQMASWIFSDHEESGCWNLAQGKKRRIIIAQGTSQIFVTFAIYDEEYVKFLRATNTLSESGSSGGGKDKGKRKRKRKSKGKGKAKRKAKGKGKGKPAQPAEDDVGGFLEMHEVGPFMVGESSHMRSLGALVLAIVAQTCGWKE